MAEFGLLGRKLGHSYSPQIHALLGDYRYELIELEPDDFEAFVRGRGFRGMNVTIPYKRVAYDLCDELTPEALAMQNVNTLIVSSEGTLIGHNTDLYGFGEMLRTSGARVAGEKVAVLGSGGAAHTAMAVLRAQGAMEILCISRRGPIDYEALYRDHKDVTLLVNATPLGMFPDTTGCPVDLARLPALRCVLDMIYNPHRTRLLLEAEARSIPCENGLLMLVAQAARACELFTGACVPAEAIGNIRKEVCLSHKNLVLIGMPGSGKSSIGLEIARRMHRPFIDIDKSIEALGMSIPQLFAQYGEAHFRALESREIRKASAQNGVVIATGGGAPIDPENVRCLRQNGELVLIERPLSALDMRGRPLSKNIDALVALQAARRPIYHAASRFAVQNTGTLEQSAQAVMEGFYEIAGD